MPKQRSLAEFLAGKPFPRLEKPRLLSTLSPSSQQTQSELFVTKSEIPRFKNRTPKSVLVGDHASVLLLQSWRGAC
ncbi:hypothetical protein V6N13_098480 [Hibiscus sabdariffa]